ncbi:cytochrome p450 domain-containing protein [Ditylenchus destructor]|uniref:Cytochrome p450 domain-containing protein n=1 Tax=Ditylenchus destructor TaxID=166010 RepID=A0AAD4N068_9BILA|nr:cytochrome p450 domain-containing protein [Ditylenchus destructor]
MAVTIPILIFLISILLYYAKSIFYYIEKRRRYVRLGEQIYGPKALPLIGNAHQFPKSSYGMSEYFLKVGQEATEKGENLVRLWLGPNLVVIPLNGEAAKDILENSTELKKGHVMDFFFQWLGNALLLSHDEQWRHQRRMLTPTFHFSMLGDYIHSFNRQVKIFVANLEKHTDTGAMVNIYPSIISLTLDVTCETIMGLEMSSQSGQNQAYMNAVKNFNSYAMIKYHNPQYSNNLIWHWFGYGKQTDEAVKILKEMSGNVVKERMKMFEEDNSANKNVEERPKRGKNFLDLLMGMQTENKLSFEELREQVDTFLFAGHDTTAHAISWTIWCLACHQDIQERLYEEIHEHFGSDTERDVTTDDLNQLKYLEMCIKESQRITPAVPFVQRSLRNDLNLGGKLVPAGTTISISPLLIHNNCKIYPEYNVYNPDNFLPEKVRERHAYDFIPFSAGPRNCIGQKFAMLEMKVALVHTLRRFSFSTEHKFHDNKRGTEAVLSPILGVPVILKRRPME